MPRELSSRFTFIYRWLIPGLLTVVAVIALWQLASGDGAPDALALLKSIAVAAAAVVLARCFDRAKRVWLDGDQLIFSAYGKEYVTPVDNIVAVHETVYFRPHRVCVAFRNPTPFGSRIVFFPPLNFAAWFAEHPVARELQQCIGADDHNAVL